MAFDNGEVYGWNMEVQGSVERILNDVVPHEVAHTVFASQWRKPLPRWLDEGMATLAESHQEHERQHNALNAMLGMPSKIAVGKGFRFIPLHDLFALGGRYARNVGASYAEGFSVVEFLLHKGGKEKLVAFVGAQRDEGWRTAFKKVYGYDSADQIESEWLSWYRGGLRECLACLFGKRRPRPPTRPPVRPQPPQVGPQGPAGPQGPQGERGPQGPPGEPADVSELLERIEQLAKEVQRQRLEIVGLKADLADLKKRPIIIGIWEDGEPLIRPKTVTLGELADTPEGRFHMDFPSTVIGE